MVKNIQEGNLLIAKFVGFSYPNVQNEVWRANVHDLHNYHEDWRLLMPVVEKIENIELDEFKPISVNIENYECEIKDYRKGHLSFAYYECKSKIESVWLAVVEFIKWYNQNLNNND